MRSSRNLKPDQFKIHSVENGNVTGDRIIDTNFSEQYNCWDNRELRKLRNNE